MKLWASLKDGPDGRAGTLWATEADRVVYEPVRCRGEADNRAAAAHANPEEDPTKPFGDHPYGVYLVTAVVAVAVDEPKFKTYGPFFLALRPVSGEAWTAREQGREGFGLHGGRLHPDGRLRETFGCLRADDDSSPNVNIRLAVGLPASQPVIEDLAQLVQAELVGKRQVFYECQRAA